MASIAVIIKTHIWSDHLEKYCIKIYHETKDCNIDLYILMHDENDTLFSKIKDDNLKKNTLIVNEKTIKNIYSIGFYSMWLSNHWLMMWFYQKFKDKYDYIWSMEHDVRITGTSSKIWLHSTNEDFLYVTGNCILYENMNRKYYIGGKLSDNQKYQGFLQLSRYSANFLNHMNKCFNEGENGQDELIIFSLARRDNFSYSCKFLSKLVRGVWSWQKKYAHKNWLEYKQLENYNKNNNNKYLAIFHPIK